MENSKINKPNANDKIKEVMNTSAPICISSYIKGSNNRPKGSVATNRRQASFNSTGSGFQTQQNRRGNVSGGAADLGIVAGQTMNLSRTKYREDGSVQRNPTVMVGMKSKVSGLDETMSSGNMNQTRQQH